MRRSVPSLLASVLLASAALTGCGGGDADSDRASAPTTTSAAPAPDGADAVFRLAVADGKTTIGSIGTDVETAIKGAEQRSDAELATVAGVTGADTGSDGGSGKITVQYATPRTKTEKIAQQLLEVGGTDGVAAGFSQRFVLPTDLRIQAVRGFVGPNYDPGTKTVTLSYGFVDYIASVIRRNDPKITDDDLGGEIAAIDGFILVHELGHAFADVFQLPLTGREEDSVDQLATVFLDNAWQMLLKPHLRGS